MDYALFGFPVNHSLSPTIHQAFAKALAISLNYVCIPTPLGSLQNALVAFRAQGGQGANVTVPLKQEAFSLCQKLTSRAEQAKAVNTLFWERNVLWGDNTDGEGLRNYLVQDLKYNLQDKRILILGAGGATQGILYPLLEERVNRIVIVNRNKEKAKKIISQLKNCVVYHYEEFNQHEEAAFDVVINATSASLSNEVPPLSERFVKNSFAIDLAYRKNEETVFMQWAKLHGAKEVDDGIGMLVEQAALAFQRWHRILPKTKDVILMLRNA